MAGKKRVGALVQRFEAAQRNTKPSTAAAAAGACDVVVEGSVETLIAFYNGMARSLPDFPRSAYTRSTRTRAREPLSPVAHEEPVERQEPQHSRESMWEQAEGAADADEEEEPSTCDETESIHSLSSSFMSDSSFDDHTSDASLYYESEYLAYHRRAVAAEPDAEPEAVHDSEPEEENEPTKLATESSCALASLEPDAEPITLASPPSLPAAKETTQTVASVPSEPETEPIATPRVLPPAPAGSDDTAPSKNEPLPKMPRTLLPSRIPIWRGSSLARAADNKGIEPLFAAVSGGSETSRPFGGVGSLEIVKRERCDPSVPRSPAKREVCRRFAAASSPSPRKLAETKKESDRRHTVSSFNPKTMAPGARIAAAPLSASATMMKNKKRRSSVTAPSARSHGVKVPTLFVGTKPAATPALAPKFTPIVHHHPIPINSRAAIRTQTRPPTPPSVPAPLQNAEIRLDRIKSRLFDYENDPKRLEIVAANRARRKSLEARAAA